MHTIRKPCCRIVTGARGAGKTTWLRAAALQHDRVAAVIQQEVGGRTEGRARGFDMEYISLYNGKIITESARLARSGDAASAQGIEKILTRGPFVFDVAAFARAESFVRNALRDPRGLDVLALDEISFLEMEEGRGLKACLELALAALQYRGDKVCAKACPTTYPTACARALGGTGRTEACQAFAGQPFLLLLSVRLECVDRVRAHIETTAMRPEIVVLPP